MTERVIERGGVRTRIALDGAGVVTSVRTEVMRPVERAFPEPLADLRGPGLRREGGVR